MVKQFETQAFASAEAMPDQEKNQAEQEAPQEESVLASLSLEPRTLRGIDIFSNENNEEGVDQGVLGIIEEGDFEEAFSNLEEKDIHKQRFNILEVTKEQLELMNDKELMGTLIGHMHHVRDYNSQYLYNMTSRMEEIKNKATNLKEEEKEVFQTELEALKKNFDKNVKYISEAFQALNDELGILELRGMKMKAGKEEGDKIGELYSETFAKEGRDINNAALSLFEQYKVKWEKELNELLEKEKKVEELSFSDEAIGDWLESWESAAASGEGFGSFERSKSEGLLLAKENKEEWMSNKEILTSFLGEEIAYLENLYKSLTLAKLSGENYLQEGGLGDLSANELRQFLMDNNYIIPDLDDALKNLGIIMSRYQEFNEENSKISLSDKKQLEILKKLSELK